MNKSSQITALLFVLILVFSLTACSGGSDDDYDSDHGEIEANTNLKNAKYWYDEFGGVWGIITASELPTSATITLSARILPSFTTNTETISAVFGNTPEEIL